MHVAEVIASAALLLTLYQAYYVRKQNRISNKVHLSLVNILSANNPDNVTYKVILENNGRGSAYINSIEFHLGIVEHSNSYTFSTAGLVKIIEKIVDSTVASVIFQSEKYEIHPRSNICLLSFSGSITESDCKKLKDLNGKLSTKVNYDTEFSSGLNYTVTVDHNSLKT